MYRVLCCLGVLGALLSLGQPSQGGGDANQVNAAVYKALEGHWELISLIVDGTPLKLSGRSISTFKGYQYVNRVDDKVAEHGVFGIDATKTPMHLNIQAADGPEKGKVNVGILEIQGETIRMCVHVAGNVRPTELASRPGSGLVLQTYRRIPQ